jgi:putative cell wall-binding protein
MIHIGRTGRIMLTSVLVAALCIGVIGTQVVTAAGTYSGGVYDYPRFVPNDHTAFALRYDATGLTPDATYYVKMRFTEGTKPSPGSNRGYTWNPTTETWVQESDSWSDFPQVTADGSGDITGSAGWVFGKFGDDTKSGPYYVMISLKPVLGGDTLNPLDPPTTTVMDMTTTGSWVHNGVATGQAAAKRAEATLDTSSTLVYGLSKTEANLIDDDSDGTIDDEDHGPAGATGDVRLGVPATTGIDVFLKQSLWLDDVSSGAPDTDIALGAADTTPPGTPTGLSVDLGDLEVTLNWTAAPGATGHHVFRWTDAPVGAKYSPIHEHIGSTTGTTFTDTDVQAGITYRYEVRGYDAATNVGPRSASASGVPVTDAVAERVQGLDRYATAAAVSRDAFASATTVVLATGADYPDALAAAGLAGVYDAPLLLTRPTALPDATTDELERLGAPNVILVGGTAAISQGVQNALASSYTVTRFGGSDRYDTAAKVATEIVSKSGADTAFFARGDGFADALASGPYAFDQGLPILLVRTDSVPKATSDVMGALALADGVIVGGTAAVSADTYADIRALLSGRLSRVSGATRYETAKALADFAASSTGLDSASFGHVGLSTGEDYPDALSGSAAIGKMGGVMLLTRPDSLPAITSSAISSNKPFIEDITIFGGPNAVSEDVKSQVAALIE